LENSYSATKLIPHFNKSILSEIHKNETPLEVSRKLYYFYQLKPQAKSQ